jgi:hypothetical protein
VIADENVQHLFGLCPSMCGKALLFREVQKIFLAATPLLALTKRIRNGGIAAQSKIDEPEKRSFSAHRAAEPQVIQI